jgi:PAS domain S-box-containing protein
MIRAELKGRSVRLFDHINAIEPIAEILDEPGAPPTVSPKSSKSITSRRFVIASDGGYMGTIEWVAPPCRSRAVMGRIDALLRTLGSALELDRDYRIHVDTAQRLGILQELNQAAADAPDYRHALNAFLKVISIALDADCAQAWSTTHDQYGAHTTYETEHVFGIASRANDFCAAVRADLAMGDHERYGSGMMHRDGLLVARIDELDIMPGTYLAAVARYGFRSLVSIPVRRGDVVLGFTLLFDRAMENSPELRRLMADLSSGLSDLLQRKISEDRVALLTSALECSNDAVAITEADGLRAGIGDFKGPSARIVYVNRAFTELTGYTAAEAIGNSAAMLHGPQSDSRIIEASIQARAQRTDARGEIIHYRKDGTPHWVRFSAAPVFDAQNNCNHYVVIYRDIMEWRAAQDALAARAAELRRLSIEQRTVLDALPANIVLLHANGDIRSVNRGWAEYAAAHGLEGGVDWQTMNYFDICRRAAATGDRGMVDAWRAIQEVLSGDQEACSFDYPCHAPGAEQWFRCFFVNLPDDEAGYVAMHIDVTVRVRAIQQMTMALKTAEEADRMKGEFLANMSHELRTPLNAICGFSEMMKNEMLGPLGTAQYKEYAKDIHDSGSHLLAVISDVLDMAKVSAGAMVLSPDWLDPRDPLRLAIKMGGASMEAADIRIDQGTRDSVPEIYADGRRLAQTLLNLLSNAVKFSAAGSPIHVTLGTSSDGGFMIDVADAGIGMDAAEIGIALQPFKQVQGHLARSYEGTGLGLPLAKSLSELNGASFSIVSEKSIGTRVSLIWPPERVRWA